MAAPDAHPATLPVKMTYFVEVISSWCYWVEPAWAELKRRFDGKVHFEWRLALMDASGLPVSREQCDWFYRRSGPIMRSPFMLNSGWFEPELKEYLAPNLVAEAARDFGVTDDRARLAIAHAAVREGKKVGQWTVSAEAAGRACGVIPDNLLQRAQSDEVLQRARASTAIFHQLQVSQRPAFLLESVIGDKAVFSGVVALEPLAATLEAMLHDARAYASHAAHYGAPPAQ